ncbi:MAG: lipid IV(A) 4-amino-4-deoxy-L-arabinosyltransferase [Proteobacteria bacterium]|nr:lipid IV(A) 4-amino-4-deoxy-L-arabinosyltransferase [Pseudomonadota bacterium]MCL2306689.1 lipid IV(A) 4-amino-4-deoxy-L-arabinosyltransferase [Pseudomonadota bacterium]
MTISKSLKSLKAAALFLFFGLFYLLPLNIRLLWQPDETRYAEISREMLARGDWIVPQFLGLRYFEKPVAGYWLNNISQWLFGENNFSVRFASAFCTALSAALIFWLAMRLWQNRQKAWAATVIYLSCFLVYAIGTYSALDSMLALWLTATMVGCYEAIHAATTRRKIIAALLTGVACGMAFMTKGFLALVLPVIAVAPYMLWQRRIKDLFVYGLLIPATAALVSAPWAIAVALKEPDYWHYFFWVEHVQRFAAEDAQHRRPFWFYVPVLLAGALPWLGLLPSALAQGWRRRREQPALTYLLCWVAMPFLFFSVAKGKLPTYILPCFAPLALLMAHVAIEAANQGRWRMLAINGRINGIVGLLLFFIFIGVVWTTESLYEPDENFKVALVLASFLFWSAVGWWAAHRSQESAPRWWLVALCPLLFGLIVGYVVPQKTAAHKQPQQFINSIRAELADSHIILSNNVGVAAGLAWEMKRSDIKLFSRKGELEYGLSYADSADHFVPAEGFSDWLQEARRHGHVSLLLLDGKPERMPPPDSMVAAENGPAPDRFFFLYYRQTP